ncbi:Esterase/lipase [Thermobacillus xylanilyticus]|uniref:Esterase/lipase n=1 Tax=Thermobacillus xylanilyticus TaxID=76633 RepID=A0ABN7SCA2_THEXY|nr:alpha/beta hydrolase [Thermobacillus xylanilyticus]CAG5091873.1 Esterase/lipase [Thermobacillus xylanilyticus]
MITKTHALWRKEEYTYPVTGDFVPNLVTYVHEDDEIRPALIVVPGGGYILVSPTEGEIVAKAFYDKGCNVFVLTYTTNLLQRTPLKMQPLKDLSQAVRFVRKQAREFRIDPEKVAICGFSAGGHLCGSLAVHHDAEALQPVSPEYEGVSNRPDAVILCYPVISSGEYAHQGSFKALLGPEATAEELAYMSLEKQVSRRTPPVFLWHTATDEAVPVENSLLFAKACKENGVPFELHVFGNGRHGLSLANRQWASGEYGRDYTMQQVYEALQYLIDHRMELPPPYDQIGPVPEGADARQVVNQFQSRFAHLRQPDDGIAMWPELAHQWLKKIFALQDADG